MQFIWGVGVHTGGFGKTWHPPLWYSKFTTNSKETKGRGGYGWTNGETNQLNENVTSWAALRSKKTAKGLPPTPYFNSITYEQLLIIKLLLVPYLLIMLESCQNHWWFCSFKEKCSTYKVSHKKCPIKWKNSQRGAGDQHQKSKSSQFKMKTFWDEGGSREAKSLVSW